MEVRDPETGAPLLDDAGAPVTITLLGRDSEVYQHTERSQTNRRLQDGARGRRIRLTAEGLDAEALELLVACTQGWSGIDWGETKPLPYSSANARMLYTNLPWLRDQVDQFISERANFFNGSKPS